MENQSERERGGERANVNSPGVSSKLEFQIRSWIWQQASLPTLARPLPLARSLLVSPGTPR